MKQLIYTKDGIERRAEAIRDLHGYICVLLARQQMGLFGT